MPHPLQIFSQSGYLIQIVAINLHTWWQTLQIQISWLLQKPTDLDLHCLQNRVYPGSAGQGLSAVAENGVVLAALLLKMRIQKVTGWVYLKFDWCETVTPKIVHHLHPLPLLSPNPPTSTVTLKWSCRLQMFHMMKECDFSWTFLSSVEYFKPSQLLEHEKTKWFFFFFTQKMSLTFYAKLFLFICPFEKQNVLLRVWRPSIRKCFSFQLTPPTVYIQSSWRFIVRPWCGAVHIVSGLQSTKY